jgi:uncharacterized protein (TIGR02271 family)
MAKPFFLTSELWALLGAGVAILAAAAFADTLGAESAWPLLAVVVGAYMLSRGAAKRRRRPIRRAQIAAPVAPAAPAVPQRDEGTPPEGMTLSEERLYVDKRERPRERVRLTKYVVTEEVTITVPVRREEVRIERVPITGDETVLPGDDSAAELTLMEEEPVVEKRVLPRERVRLEKDVRVEERHISESLRREEIDIEHEGEL